MNMSLEDTVRYVSRNGEAGRVHVIRLKTGCDLLRTLEAVINEKGISAAVILSGVGLLSRARIRNCMNLPEEFPITDRNRDYQSIDHPCEILGMSGNVSKAEGKPLLHGHLTLSYVVDGRIIVVGGHMIPGSVVHGFAEIIVMELKDIDMLKNYDEETKTLQLFS
jgi:predicted DNA-binding protein with PD1-like motif